MAPPRKPPSYLKHRGVDGRLRARTFVDGKEEYLGPYGSPESHARHQEIVSEWHARRSGAGGQAVPPAAGKVRTVEHLAARFWAHAQLHYRLPDGTPKKELKCFEYALQPLRRLYGYLPVSAFGPKALKTLRAAMVSGSWMNDAERARRAKYGKPVGWSRRLVNRMVIRIRTVFGWGVEEELAPDTQLQKLRSVRGLEEGELGARETDDVPPVPEEDLAATIQRLGPIVRAMVEVQLLTGARPGELVKLRPCDLIKQDRVRISKKVTIEARGCWVYLPAHHKTKHKGHRRVILFGPKAQDVLRPLLEGRDPQAFIFSPRESIQLFRARQRAERKTPVQPSQKSRAKLEPRKRPGDRYTVDSYGKAIKKACEARNGRVAIDHWHPHQLRHNTATRLVEQFGEAGWELARVVLGHRTVDTTRIYALDAYGKAAKAMSEVG